MSVLLMAVMIVIAANMSQAQTQTVSTKYDLIIRNGMIYNGRGGKPFKGDVAINADTIAAIGNLHHAKAKEVTDAKGMAVSPGFINMLSQSAESLIIDGRSQGDIRQGVTLEVMGEGWSMGPLNSAMKNELASQGSTEESRKIEWTTLGEYLTYLEKRGVACNVASFVGATTARRYILGDQNRSATPAQLDSMRLLVRQAMQEGAMGLSSSLIYPPAFFATTEELIALAKEAAAYEGMYISHIRNESNGLLIALEELMTIAQKANIHAEIYHMKAVGKTNWNKMDSVVKRVERARREGLRITANMYPYVASATSLTTAFPPALQDSGFGKLKERLQDTAVRRALKRTMNTDAADWDNRYFSAGPDNILLLDFAQDSLRKYIGKTLSEVARMRHTSPEETAMDLIVQDSIPVTVAYFIMKEENIKKQMILPWTSFGSDGQSSAPEGVFLKFNPHPRSYGTFARVLGKYTREERLLPLQEAIRKLSKLPATNLKLKKRGELRVGNYADVVVFDPAAVADHATFDKPHQYATGVQHVFVNGVQVLKKGEHTGATPGRFVKGPGYKSK